MDRIFCYLILNRRSCESESALLTWPHSHGPLERGSVRPPSPLPFNAFLSLIFSPYCESIWKHIRLWFHSFRQKLAKNMKSWFAEPVTCEKWKLEATWSYILVASEKYEVMIFWELWLVSLVDSTSDPVQRLWLIQQVVGLWRRGCPII